MSDLSQRIAKIERAIKMLNVRTRTQLDVLVPSIPIMAYVDHPLGDGSMFTFTLPAKGEITKAWLAIKNILGKEGVEIEVALSREGEKFLKSFTFPLKQKKVNRELNIQVEAGDMLEVFVDRPGDVEGLSLSFLYVIDREECQKISFDLESLGIGNEGVRQLIG